MDKQQRDRDLEETVISLGTTHGTIRKERKPAGWVQTVMAGTHRWNYGLFGYFFAIGTGKTWFDIKFSEEILG